MLLVPKVKPVSVARVLPLWTLALARLELSPLPVTAKVWPFTPVATKVLPATAEVLSYTLLPLKVRLALLIMTLLVPPVLVVPLTDPVLEPDAVALVLKA